jgi:small subunit ribosomal protein S21
MAKVIVKPDEPIGQALRRFKKICDKEGVVNRSKRATRFEKPSERRRREELDRLKTIRKAQNAAGDMAKG